MYLVRELEIILQSQDKLLTEKIGKRVHLRIEQAKNEITLKDLSEEIRTHEKIIETLRKWQYKEEDLELKKLPKKGVILGIESF